MKFLTKSAFRKIGYIITALVPFVAIGVGVGAQVGWGWGVSAFGVSLMLMDAISLMRKED